MKFRIIAALIVEALVLSTLPAGSKNAESPPAGGYKFIYYKDFIALLQKLKSGPLYDKYIRMKDGFAHYNISPIPQCGNDPCQNPIIEVADFVKGPAYVQSLPTVSLIAGFHGDEVVGTNALYRMLEMFNEEFFTQEKWSRLLGNVRLLILPMANVNGFHGLKREETIQSNGQKIEADPNRDFPYDEDKSNGCFTTSTAELIDAMFRDNIIVGCLTFHGGDNSITYPWGNFPHGSQPQSGDHIAFDATSKVLTAVSGSNLSLKIEPYGIGTLHDVVYDVQGGFEDWGYGASFDTRYIDKTCGIRSNPKFGLFPQDITYNDITNRAFLFLVEAGYQKIPDENTLGDLVSIETEDFSKGTWGHLARNVNLSLRFAQIVGPFATFSNLAYQSNSLTFDLWIYGCVAIDSVASEGFTLQELSKKYDQAKNIWKMSFRTEMNAGTQGRFPVHVQCDGKWAEPTKGQYPQSHLVRMRTNSNYAADHNNYKLRSNKILRSSLLNIRTADVASGVLYYAGHSEYAMTYVSSLKTTAIVPNGPGKNFKGFKALFKDGSMTVASDSSTSQTVRIYSYATSALPSKARTAPPRYLLEVKTSEPVKITKENFISLTGRSVEVYEESSPAPIYQAVLALDTSSAAEDEEKNSLPLPVHGLSCYQPSASNPGGFEFAYVAAGEEMDSIKVSLFTTNQVATKFKVGTFEGEFPSTAEKSLIKQSVRLSVPAGNGLRLLGASLQAFDSAGASIFLCTLGLKDPYTDVAQDFGFPLLEAPGSSYTRYQIVMIVIIVCVFFALLAYFIRRWVNRKQQAGTSERYGHELSSASITGR